MSKYLSPPHIQLGFYWLNELQNESFQRVLSWLLSYGYNHPTEALALNSTPGAFPSYTTLSEIGAHLRRHVSPKDVESSNRLQTNWVPVDLYLSPKSEENVEVTLSYGPIYADEMPLQDHHPIRITASGSEWNVIENANGAKLPSKIVARARRTQKWQRRTFEALVSQLHPDLGGSFLEWSLQTPSAIMQSKDLSDFNGLYISGNLVPVNELEAELCRVESWQCSQVGPGIQVRCSSRGSKSADFGMGILRQYLQKAFSNHRPC